MKKRILIGIAVGALALGGASISNADLLGHYSNFDNSPPDMQSWLAGVELGYVESTLTGDSPTLTDFGATRVAQWDLWNAGNEVFSRPDSDGDLQSGFAKSWFPVTTRLDRDPYHFSVHWGGQFYAASDQVYDYSMGSDDGSWLFVDNSLALNTGDVHTISSSMYNAPLTAGGHDVDIFFAEKHKVQSGFNLNFFRYLEPPNTGPEPTTMLLFGIGLVCLAGARLRKKKK